MLASLFVVLAIPASPMMWPGYANDAAVEGLRPAPEVRAALKTAAAALNACMANTRSVVVDVSVLAAGFVDKVAAVEGDASPCVVDALRAVAFKDRGKEAPTHVVVRLAVTDDAQAPAPGTSPRDVQAAVLTKRDDVARCTKKLASAGTVLARFTVDKDGGVKDVDTTAGTLKGDAQNDAIRACVATAIRGVHFAGGRSADVELTWPLWLDKRLPRADFKKPGSFLDQPTLFDVIGCNGVFSP